jgi:HEAT repeat protein
VRDLDVTLLSDLLRVQEDAARQRALAALVRAEIERRTAQGELLAARQLTEALAGHPDVLDRLASGPLARHIVSTLKKSGEEDPEPLDRLCTAVGPRLARPLAMALAAEEQTRVIQRLRELLLAYGAAGRQAVEQLKNSANPAIRRMAIDLLRVFGGREALPELASMLGDADPQVQREAIRAIVLIGTQEAYAVLERALVAGGQSRETIIQELVSLRDAKAIPLLCYVLAHTSPRGRLVDVHVRIIDALGGLGDHADSVEALRDMLHRGDWWAPARTARLHSSRGVRAAARAQLEAGLRRQQVQP